MAKKRKPADRTIEFFRVRQKVQDGPKVDIEKITKDLAAAQKSKNNSCTLKSNEEVMRAHVIAGQNQDGVLLTITRNKVPPGLVDDAGLTGIRVGNKSVGEYCHLVFFKPNFVGVAVHQHSPSMSNFSELLSARIPELGELVFDQCVNPNFFDRLNELKSVKGIRMTVTESTIEKLKTIDGDYAASLENILNNGFKSFQVYLTTGRGENANASNWIDKMVRKILKRKNAKDEFDALKLKLYGPTGDDMRRVMIDLFADKITKQKSIDYKIGEKILDDESAFTAIVEAFNDRRILLKESISMGDLGVV